MWREVQVCSNLVALLAPELDCIINWNVKDIHGWYMLVSLGVRMDVGMRGGCDGARLVYTLQLLYMRYMLQFILCSRCVFC